MVKILVVDDDDTMRRAYARLLKQYKLTIVASAAEALRHVRAGFRHDLVLTDKDMCGMGGVALIAELRKLGLVAPIIVVTGDLNCEQVRSATVVHKPFDNVYLLATIAAQLAPAPSPAV